MPTTASTEEKPKKRAPRMRSSAAAKTVKKTTAKKAVRKRVPRKRVVSKKEVSSRESTASRSTRKAPTSIAANRASNKAKQNQWLTLFAILFVSAGLSAAVGFTDKGQIDVNLAIEERNERIRSGQLKDGENQRIIVPIQNTEANQLPDGGLIGLGDIEEPPAPEPVPTSTASSTDGTATTTVDVADSEGETNEEPEEIGDPGAETEVLDEATEPEPVSGEEIIVEPTSGR